MKCMICGADGCKCGGPAILSGTPVGSEVKKMSVGIWVSDRRLYLDAGGQVVEEGDPTRASLLVPVGGKLPMARALELGLVKEASESDKPAKAAKEDKSEVSSLKEEIKTLKEDIKAKDAEIKALKEASTQGKAQAPVDDKAVKPGETK